MLRVVKDQPADAKQAAAAVDSVAAAAVDSAATVDPAAPREMWRPRARMRQTELRLTTRRNAARESTMWDPWLQVRTYCVKILIKLNKMIFFMFWVWPLTASRRLSRSIFEIR